MNGKSDRTDETDVLAQNETLAADLATEKASVTKLTADLKTANAAAARVPDLEASIKAANDSVDSITKERDGLKTENESLKAKMADFDKEVAAALAKRGISDKAVEAPGKEKTEAGVEGLVAKYEAVKNDPKKRAEFLKAHGDALRVLLN